MRARLGCKIVAWTLVLFISVYFASEVSAQSDDGDSRPIDIVILKDESLSMRRTDPGDLRDQAVYMLADELELAGEGNRVSLILFGTQADIKVGLGADLASLRDEQNLHYPDQAPVPEPFRSLASTPRGGFTDFYLGLKRAAELLETTDDGSGRERYVVVLTDGKIQPWPGHDRFAEFKIRYWDEVLSESEGIRQSASDAFSDRYCANIDRTRIEEELLPKYRRNNWRIHAIGFHSAVEQEFLEMLARETGGDIGTVDNAHEMVSLLDDMLPTFRNVIRFKDVDLCKGNVSESVFVPPVGALSFRFSFSTRGGQILPTPEQVRVELESADGHRYSSVDSPVFRQYRNRKGQLLQLTAQFQAPRKGQWLVRVRGIGIEPCGLLRVAAYRKQTVEINLNPNMEYQTPGSEVLVQTLLVSLEGPVPLAGASAELLRKGEGVVSGITLSATDSTSYVAKVRLPDVEDSYDIRVKLIDATTGAVVVGHRTIQVKEQLCGVRLQPTQLSLGVIGGDLDRTERQEVSVLLDCPATAEVSVDKPVLSRRGVELPIEWIRVDPLVGSYNPISGTYRIGVWMELPSALPSGVVSGEYSGTLVVRSPSFREEYQELPVKVRVDIPRLVVRPEQMEMTFSRQISATLDGSMSVKVAGSGTHDVEVNYSGELYSPEVGSGRVKFELVDSRGRVLPPNGGQALRVSQRSGVDLQVRVRLDDPLLHEEGVLDPDTRVPAGVYEGRIEIYGDRLASQSVSVYVSVPESSWSMYVRDWLPRSGLLLVAVVGVLVLLAMIFRLWLPTKVVQKRVADEFTSYSVEGVITEVGGVVRVRIKTASSVEPLEECTEGGRDAVSASSDLFSFIATVAGREITYNISAEDTEGSRTWEITADRARPDLANRVWGLAVGVTALVALVAICLVVLRLTLGRAV